MTEQGGKPYRSKYEQYTFLSDRSADLRCDFEIATDEFASEVGLLAAILKKIGGDERSVIAAELLKVEDLVYHANPTLRTKFTITDDEMEWFAARTLELKEQTDKQESLFQLPCGCEEACRGHILRSKAKALVRMCYRAEEGGLSVPEGLYDFLNILSAYFYRLALRLNQLAGVQEIPYYSRNYK